MILIVNSTADRNITEELRRYTDDKGLDAEFIEAYDMKIGPCIGCNYCWLKNPGECTVKDDYEKILKRFIKADQMWVISDTALGFIDHKGKNLFDRVMPAVTMYLYFKGDQMRHVLRYDQRTDIGLIITGEADREYLARWNERAALNFDSKALGVFSKDELKEAVTCMH